MASAACWRNHKINHEQTTAAARVARRKTSRLIAHRINVKRSPLSRTRRAYRRRMTRARDVMLRIVIRGVA